MWWVGCFAAAAAEAEAEAEAKEEVQIEQVDLTGATDDEATEDEVFEKPKPKPRARRAPAAAQAAPKPKRAKKAAAAATEQPSEAEAQEIIELDEDGELKNPEFVITQVRGKLPQVPPKCRTCETATNGERSGGQEWWVPG